MNIKLFFTLLLSVVAYSYGNAQVRVNSEILEKRKDSVNTIITNNREAIDTLKKKLILVGIQKEEYEKNRDSLAEIYDIYKDVYEGHQKNYDTYKKNKYDSIHNLRDTIYKRIAQDSIKLENASFMKKMGIKKELKRNHNRLKTIDTIYENRAEKLQSLQRMAKASSEQFTSIKEEVKKQDYDQKIKDIITNTKFMNTSIKSKEVQIEKTLEYKVVLEEQYISFKKILDKAKSIIYFRHNISYEMYAEDFYRRYKQIKDDKDEQMKEIDSLMAPKDTFEKTVDYQKRIEKGKNFEMFLDKTFHKKLDSLSEFYNRMEMEKIIKPMIEDSYSRDSISQVNFTEYDADKELFWMKVHCKDTIIEKQGKAAPQEAKMMFKNSDQVKGIIVNQLDDDALETEYFEGELYFNGKTYTFGKKKEKQ